MADPTLVAVVGMLIASIPGIVAYKNSRSTTKAVDSKVDTDAFKQAKIFYDAALIGYRTELAEAKDELKTVKSDNKFLQMRIGELERIIRRLESEMKRAGLPLPPETDVPNN